jgi:lipopolysaccharide/colanic/teichoic acid biosynthesis glycosyltransferase
MRRRIDRLWIGRKVALVTGDAAVFMAATAAVVLMRDGGALTAGLFLSFLPVLGACVLAAYAAGLYEFRLVRDFVSLVGGLIASSAVSLVVGTMYFYVFAPYVLFAPKASLVLIIAAAHLGMLGWRRLVLAATGFGLMDLRILILGDRAYGEALRGADARRTQDDFQIVDSLAERVDLVVVDRSWTDRHAHESRAVLSAAIGARVPIVSLADFHESLYGKVSSRHANDLTWALDHVLPRGGSMYFFLKRAVDVVAAAVLLAALAPVLAAVALLIRVVDGAAPFYAQERVGYLGRRFRLWKFRTMREGADRDGPFREDGGRVDLHVTRLGAVLRRWRIDELPQLANVVKGDMSLVGPRPQWVREVEILETSVPTYSLRYLVPPGLTGWAQVYFRATSCAADAIEKHHYDLYYLKHFSLSLDFSILLKTLKRAFVPDSRMTSAPAYDPVEADRAEHAPLDVRSIVDRLS